MTSRPLALALALNLNLLLIGCGASAPPLPICSAAMPPSSTPSSDPKTGAAACAETGAVMINAATDLSVDGYTTVGPAFTYAATGPFQHGVDFVLPYQTGKVDSSIDNQLVVLAQYRKAPAHAAMVSNIVVERGQSKVHFHATDVATFQIAKPNNAGQPYMRHFTYRAIGGVSMGGFGSSVNFWMHPDHYDAIGVMGADPGPDMTYSLGMIHDWFLSGFCTAQDDPQKIGQLCAPARQPLADQGEVPSTFEAFHYEPGNGVGLTLSRNTYIKANRDLARAMDNASTYNPASKYLPPGVPDTLLTMDNATVCNTPVVLKKFYDYRYNPTGSFDVITFCDGNDSQQNGLGKFDPSVPATNPTQILLAVDVNQNGKRDSGEPVIVQGSEPWKDVGVDGLADKDEPGYDPVNNPDPNGDDYHYLWNPTGTENNWRYDQGEPFDDFGIDGVPKSVGGCDADSGQPNCYDYGEGNGKYDYNPSFLSWKNHDPRTNMEALMQSDVQRLDVYYDAGIRDFFNAEVSTNSLLGALTAHGAPVRAVDGFPTLIGLPKSQENNFDVNKVVYPNYGRRMYVRYGDPDLTEAQVEDSGDGRHVGTTIQAVHRAQSLFYFLANVWPGGDRLIAPVDSEMANIMDSVTLSSGRVTPLAIVLPPGYFEPENQSKTYPVIYFGHGYGMQPGDLSAISVVATNAMTDTRLDDQHRMPKFILVIVDGKCRPGGEIQNGPLPPGGDLCEEGTFYTEHPDGVAKMETGLMEIDAYISQKYRAKQAADVMVTQ